MFEQSTYTEEQGMIAAAVTQLSKQYDDQYFLSETRSNNFPAAFRDELDEGGFPGILVDEKYGGAGMAISDLAVFMYTMAKAGLASFQLTNQILCSDIISRLGSTDQRGDWLPAIVRGELWCYADLEQTDGHGLFDITTTAKRDGDHFILNGAKSYAVCARMASHLIVAARTGDYDEARDDQGLSLFVVDAKTPGIEYVSEHLNVRVIGEREEMAATGDLFDTIVFDGASVPASGLIGKAGEAGEFLKGIASRQMLMVALMGLGWGDRFIEKTVAYANERVIFKDPISSYQAVQHPMVLAKTDIEMAKLLTERAVAALEGGESADVALTYCSVAKARATDAAQAACDIAMQAHGGAGYDRDTGIISLWPLVLISRLVPLNNSAILERFSEQVLGMPLDPMRDGESGRGGESGLQNLSFEVRSQREIKLTEILQKTIADARSGANARSGDSSSSGPDLMGKIMEGELAEYLDLLLADGKGVLPVKLDVFRLLSVHSEFKMAEGDSIAKSLIKTTPIKYGLSAMAMAAVSSGTGGAERVMSEYVPQMMQGKLFCYCITEPGAGTNTHNVSTIAVDEGGHYRLSGQKTFISAADTAHYMAVVARVEVDGVRGAVGTFVMEAASKGISMTELDIAALGDRQFTIYFDDVILPKSALVGTKSKPKGGQKSVPQKGISEGVFYTLNLERIMVALGALMVGRESLAKALAKAVAPRVHGPLPGASSDIKQKLAGLQLDMELINLTLKKATLAFDNKAPGKQVGMYANMAKYISSMFAFEAGELALRLYGVSGLDKELDDIGSLLQLGRVLRTVPINNEMVLNFLAENLLGLPKSYRV